VLLQGGFEVHYCQPQPRFRAAAIAPAAEQPDIESPRWSNCTVPVVFWPYWCAAAESCTPCMSNPHVAT